MSITIQIPTALRSFTDHRGEVTVEAATAGTAIAALALAYPDIKQHLYQEGGVELRSFINVFVGETNIKKLQGLDTPVPEGGDIMLVPAIAGGRQNSAQAGGAQDCARTGERVPAGSRGAARRPIIAAVGEKAAGRQAR
jgi:adenylyltransferase/sulfurtransferase